MKNIDNDIVARLEDGFGSAAGHRAQINAYHKLCLAAAAEIKELRASVAERERQLDNPAHVYLDNFWWKRRESNPRPFQAPRRRGYSHATIIARA